MDCASDQVWEMRGRCGRRMPSPVAGHGVNAGPDEWEESVWNVCPLAAIGGDGVGGRPRDLSLIPHWLGNVWQIRQWLAEGRPLDDFCGPLSAGASEALLLIDAEINERDRLEFEAARSRT